ncbi:MAG: alpha/beta fold hydrolase [Lactobacillaceae bacterium]|jgi:proline iminopeptidase|nr:alpha/beta fold hydrolase [Lactobacillaceae bacterium]
MFFKIFKRFFDAKPFNQGYLPEEDGHKIFFMEIGNPDGKPVISFHGGPGYRSRANSSKTFNLKKYRVILFDQRGCGRSIPYGEMKNNTAAKAASDAKRLLDYLKIKRKVIVNGGSWGSTLALLFAETYPEKIEKLIVSKIFLANASDEKWQAETSGLFYPDMLERLKEGAKGSADMKKYYADLINSNNLVEQVRAIELYGSYENVLGSLNPKLGFSELDADVIGSMKIFINYTAEEFTLKKNQIMNDIEKIKNIKTLIVHNRLDMVCPLRNAYELHKALPKSRLVIAPYMGHYGKGLSMVIKEEIKNFLD